MLSSDHKNKIIDICCRIISTEGEVSLEERIWMYNISKVDPEAKKMIYSMLNNDITE
jgi:hypothetical protein